MKRKAMNMARFCKKISLVLIVVLVCLFGTLFPVSSLAEDITLPEEFYGNITVNGVAASVGTVIVAKIGGEEKGSFTTTEAGIYGGSGTFDPRLVVSGEEADIRQVITFWVNGSKADQTAIYEPGESRELNLTAWVYPLQPGDAQITKALDYLREAQQTNGNIGGFSVSGWVVMAIAAAGEDPNSWNADGDSIVDYLIDKASVSLDENKATDWERSILAIVATGNNPRNFGGIDYVDKLLAFYDGSQIGSDELLNDDFWGILALAAIGEDQTIIEASKNFIVNNQNSDGGWGMTVGGASDADNTAAAVSALITAGMSPDSQIITDALIYLKGQQQNDGGFVSEGMTNSAVDSWVINAIVDAGQSPVADEWKESGKNPVEHLLSLQDTDGAFKWTATQRSKPEWMTAYALLALMGKSWPKDTTPPTISNLTPSSGASITDNRPTIRANYADAVSGINKATATLRLDGDDVTTSATVTTSRISYTASGLSTGTHSVTVRVSDKAGNEATRSWSFKVVADDGGNGGGGGADDEDYDQITMSLFGDTIRIDIDEDGEIQETVEAISDDGKLTVIIEDGTVALSADGEPLDRLEIEVDRNPPPVPGNVQIIGRAYDFDPDGATFDPPLILIYEYNDSDIPEDADEADFIVSYWDKDDEEWIELDDFTVNPQTNIITAEVSHFTTFAILAQLVPTETIVTPQPADFSVSDLTAQPAAVQPGEPVTISVLVTNTGGSEGNYTVFLEINGVKEAEQSLTIVAGSSKTVTFSVSRVEPGTYSVAVEGLSTSFTVLVPQSEPPAPSSPTGTVAEAPATPTNWPLIGGIIGGVIVVGLIIFFFVRRRAYYY